MKLPVVVYLNKALFCGHFSISLFDGYQPGDPLEKVYVMEVEGLMCLEMAEKVFTALNIDHPEDYRHRSLCVGDVVVIEGQAYACRSCGFEPIDAPPEVRRGAGGLSEI